MGRILASIGVATGLLCGAVGCGGDAGPRCGDGGPEIELSVCAGACVDTMSDPVHCGGCGEACLGDLECRGGRCCLPATMPPVLDLLLVLDNTRGMEEAQRAFVAQLPRLLRVLSTGDRDGDGEADFRPAASIHLGAITTDMGSGGYEVPTCDEPVFGDDGLLQTEGNLSEPGCMATYPNFLELRGELGPEAIAEAFACVMLDTDGCGWEQPLEATLKALTPAESDVAFFMDSSGRGEDNIGFQRPGAALAVIVLTDDDDCSASDPDIFDIDGATYPEPLGVRCAAHPEALSGIDRYVDGLAAIAALTGEAGLTYAVLGGVPVELTEAGASYEEILGDDRMQLRPDPSSPNILAPSCELADGGQATPPRRLVELARDLRDQGTSTAVQSICAADLTSAADAIVDAIIPTLAIRETCIVPL